MRAIVIAIALFASVSLTAQVTTNNIDSCEISVTPAATLLLPYFEVDTASAPGAGTTTLFTVTNTSRYPQIAHVTVWTDWGFPVLAFNIFLTGYDVQGINLYDVIVGGVVVPGSPSGTSINTAVGKGVFAATPFSNTSNPNFVTSGAMNVSTTCATLPGALPADVTAAARNALTTGLSANCGTNQVGAVHVPFARGYVTVDVVSYCTTQFPSDPDGSYFTGPTAAILFDNVLSGDYEQIGPSPAGKGGTGFDAEGGPMVHIHALPEGGLSGASGGVPLPTNLPFTFYDRYTPQATRAADRRQPLPSAWNARFIQGGLNGFATDLKIWREGIAAGQPSCQPGNDLAFNSVIALHSIIRFDEHENSVSFGSPCGLIETCFALGPNLPATSRTASSSSVFPPMFSGDVGGWLYLDLSSGAGHATPNVTICSPTLSAQRAGYGTCNGGPLGFGGSRATTQNWVISSMFGAVGASRLSVDFDAVALGNGCTPGAALGAVVGPAWHPAGNLICPNGAPASTCGAGTVRPPVNP